MKQPNPTKNIVSLKADKDNGRKERGFKIATKASQITRIDEANYEVLSQNGNGVYLISKTEDQWMHACFIPR